MRAFFRCISHSEWPKSSGMATLFSSMQMSPGWSLLLWSYWATLARHTLAVSAACYRNNQPWLCRKGDSRGRCVVQCNLHEMMSQSAAVFRIRFIPWRRGIIGSIPPRPCHADIIRLCRNSLPIRKANAWRVRPMLGVHALVMNSQSIRFWLCDVYLLLQERMHYSLLWKHIWGQWSRSYMHVALSCRHDWVEGTSHPLKTLVWRNVKCCVRLYRLEDTMS